MGSPVTVGAVCLDEPLADHNARYARAGEREDRVVQQQIEGSGESDVALVQHMARGDRAALAPFYERHGGIALAMARRMLGDAEAAEEVVQDAFVALWRRAAEFRPDGAAPRTWLLTVVRNRSIDHLRRSSGFDRLSLDDTQPAGLEADPWPEIWKRHCGDAVRAALRDLPQEQRDVIELGFFGGYSHAQIAERLATPLGTVKKRMRSGLKRMRSSLDDSFAGAVP